MLQLEVETNVLNASIDCLSTVDGYVWSVSSDFRLRQWDIRSTELAVGSGARAEGVVRSAVESQFRVITRMASPLASNNQLWVAVGNRLAVVDLSQAPKVAKGSLSAALAI